MTPLALIVLALSIASLLYSIYSLRKARIAYDRARSATLKIQDLLRRLLEGREEHAERVAQAAERRRSR